MKEKEILKETLSTSKPKEYKKKVYKPRKKKEIKTQEFNSLSEEFVMRSEEVPYIKILKQIGYYKIGKSFHIFFETKPNVFHRFFTKIFFGWKWYDQK